MGQNGRRTKSGRPKGAVPIPERRRRFDLVRWPGATGELLQDAKILTEEEIAAKWGLESRQRASQVIHYLGGKKPVVREPVRPDLTPERILKFTAVCRSQAELATVLGTTKEVLKKRFDGNSAALPYGKPGPKGREDVNDAAISLLLPECLSASEIARRLKTSHTTIFRRAKRHGLKLPNGRRNPRRGTLQLIEKIRWHAQVTKSVARIAKALNCSRRNVYYMNEKYGIGIPVEAGKFQGQRKRNKTRRSA